MPTTHALPNLFGRFTAIMSDHRQLGVTLGRLREMCAALGSDRTALADELRPNRLIDELYADLTRHFADEEAAEYFGTVMEERPALIPRIAKLKAEHTVMLETIVGLREIAADRNRWKELVVPAQRLIDELRTHEHAETLVLQEFFLRDEGWGAD